MLVVHQRHTLKVVANENPQSVAQNEKEITQSTTQNQAKTNDESVKSQTNKAKQPNTAKNLQDKMQSSGFTIKR